MNKEYKYTFKQIIQNFDLYKLGTIIESDYGIKYKMTKTDNDGRKFSRVNKGLRFMTYDNMDRLFRFVEESEQDIDIQAIEELNEEMAYCLEGIVGVWDSNEKKIVIQQNKIIKAIKQLDKNIKEKNG